VVECLLTNYKVLSSSPSIAKRGGEQTAIRWTNMYGIYYRKLRLKLYLWFDLNVQTLKMYIDKHYQVTHMVRFRDQSTSQQ
jgi:hypothetical protein